MKTFKVRVIASVPLRFEGNAEVQAQTRDEAEAKIRAMYDNDELDLEKLPPDYDEGEIVELSWENEVVLLEALKMAVQWLELIPIEYRKGASGPLAFCRGVIAKAERGEA